MRAQLEPSPEGIDLQLRRYARLLYRDRAWIAGITLLTLCASLAVTALREPEAPTEQAVVSVGSARVLIEPPPSEESSLAIGTTDMPTHAHLLAAHPTAQLVRERLSLEVDPETLLQGLQVTAEAGTRILTVTYSDAPAEETDRIARAFAMAYLSELERENRAELKAEISLLRESVRLLERRRSRSTRGDGPTRTSNLRLIEIQDRLTDAQVDLANLDRGRIIGTGSTAQVSVQPSPAPGDPAAGSSSPAGPPSLTRAGMIGLLLGLLLGASTALARDIMDGRLRTKRRLEQKLSVPVLMWHPDVPTKSDPDFERIFPAIRASLKDSNTLVVTGFAPESALSLTASGISDAAHELGVTVKLVSDPTATEQPDTSSELRLILAPPYLESPIAARLASQGTPLLFVVDGPRTREQDLRMVLEELQHAGIRPIGVFLYYADEY